MAKRIVQSLDFKKEGAHVAIVNVAANGEEVLVMKKKSSLEERETVDLKKQDVRVEMPMREFLYTFYDMWYSDAVQLAEVLGYESQETMEDDFGTSITLLKALRKEDELPEDIYSVLDNLQKRFEDKLTNGTQIMTTDVKKEDLENVDLTKKMEEMEAELLKFKTSATKQEEELAELRKQREEAEQASFVELVKGYSFVGEEEAQTKLVEALFKGRAIPGFDVVIETLEKAKKALDEVVLVEKGHSNSKDETLPMYADQVTEILKARK